MKEEQFKTLNFSLIGKTCKLNGDFLFRGDTLLSGEVEGNITVTNNGKLTIERNAIVKGQIFCQDIEIFGKFQGTINAEGTLIVRSQGDVSGKIKALSLNIYPGALLNIEGAVS